MSPNSSSRPCFDWGRIALDDDYSCPGCEAEVTLAELRSNDGYCAVCAAEHHAAWLLHRAQVERWAKLTDQQRWDEIRRAM